MCLLLQHTTPPTHTLHTEQQICPPICHAHLTTLLLHTCHTPSLSSIRKHLYENSLTELFQSSSRRITFPRTCCQLCMLKWATGQYCLCLILCRDYVVSMVTVHGLDAPIKNSRVAFNTSDLFNAVGLSSRSVESCDCVCYHCTMQLASDWSALVTWLWGRGLLCCVAILYDVENT